MEKIYTLFSGGLDSTATILKITEMKKQPVPVFIDFIVYKYKNNVLKQYNNLKNIIEIGPLHIIDGTYFFKKYLIESIERDMRKYNYNLICLGCKMLMYTLTAKMIESEKNKIIADGANRRQNYYPEQNENIIKIYENILKELNVKLIHPVYEINSKKDIKDIIFKHNISPKSLEPLCLFGDSFTHSEKIPYKTMEEYIKEKWKKCKEEILNSKIVYKVIE